MLLAGTATGIAGFRPAAAAHSATWQVIGAGIPINAYISLVYGALPLVVSEVEPNETGVRWR